MSINEIIMNHESTLLEKINLNSRVGLFVELSSVVSFEIYILLRLACCSAAMLQAGTFE